MSEQQSKKRSATVSAEEGRKKVKRTVGWYNYNANGNLQQPIIYKSLRSHLESISPWDALKILKGLEEKGSGVRNPTAWVKSAAEKLGPEADIKVRKTIVWYNKHGNLQAQIRYDEVRGMVGRLPAEAALAILKTLESKAETIRDPTAWLYKAAEHKLAEWGSAPAQGWSQTWPKSASAKRAPTSDNTWKGSARAGGHEVGSVDGKLSSTIAWYNKHGGLQQPIDLDEVSVYLCQMDITDALKVIGGMKDKAWTIKNPTSWIVKAAKKALGLVAQ